MAFRWHHVTNSSSFNEPAIQTPGAKLSMESVDMHCRLCLWIKLSCNPNTEYPDDADLHWLHKRSISNMIQYH